MPWGAWALCQGTCSPKPCRCSPLALSWLSEPSLGLGTAQDSALGPALTCSSLGVGLGTALWWQGQALTSPEGSTGQSRAQMWAEGFQACFCPCSLRPVQSQGTPNISGKMRPTPTCPINHELLGMTSSTGKPLQVGMNPPFHLPAPELLQTLNLFVLMDAWKNCGSSEQRARVGRGGKVCPSPVFTTSQNNWGFYPWPRWILQTKQPQT